MVSNVSTGFTRVLNTRVSSYPRTLTSTLTKSHIRTFTSGLLKSHTRTTKDAFPVSSMRHVLPSRSLSTEEPIDQQQKFLEEYKIRTLLEQPLYYYSRKELPKMSLSKLYEQSRGLNEESLLRGAKETLDSLLIYNARRLKEFRNLPYLVVLNPAISESYNLYLKTMSSLILASLNPPTTIAQNNKFLEVLDEFIELHADTLPLLSRGFSEVTNLISEKRIKAFLDQHLKERIRMRLIAHQHLLLSRCKDVKKDSDFNGIIQPLNIADVIKKNAELVNDICLMKYDQSVPIKIDYVMHKSYWTKEEKPQEPTNVVFPYIEYHLDYVLTELFKNSFRAHIENGISDEPVQITVSTSKDPLFLEIRIRDKGKGIPRETMNQIFDYSFSTYELNEGEAYKTLNVPPGLGGNVVAGMGYGLPLLKNYIEIFNDSEGSQTRGLLTIQTYYGWGTDVYLKTVGV